MSQLVAKDTGRLVCLEWPLHKPLNSAGPPWGLTAEVYEAHLTRPGEEVTYEQKLSPTPDRLKRMARLRPDRTHRAGQDDDGNVIDFISVWSH
jgi:hypothetical protein